MEPNLPGLTTRSWAPAVGKSEVHRQTPTSCLHLNRAQPTQTNTSRTGGNNGQSCFGRGGGGGHRGFGPVWGGGGLRWGGTPRSRSSTCEQWHNCPTLTY